MIHSDYLVVTVPLVNNEPSYPHLVSSLLGDEREPFSLYGYRGYRSRKLFVGDNGDRILVQASGSSAREVTRTIMFQDEEGLSVARIDAQVTMIVRDADRLIAGIRHNERYQATVWQTVGKPGRTLYVGAPKSDARLRVYNKSAESGIVPPDGEYLRVELQLRNRYADRMFRAFRARNPRVVWLSHVKGMIDSYVHQLCVDYLAHGYDDGIAFDNEEMEQDRIARRKLWVERTVIPALRKLFVEDAQYLTVFQELLYNSINKLEKGGDTELWH